MPWPLGSSGSSSGDKSRTDDGRPSQNSTSWNDLLPKTQEPFETALTWAPVLLAAMGSVGSYILYQNYLKRFPNAASVQENFFRRRSLLGRVTSVGDGDGFHLYHTPGGKLAGWGWLRKIPDARADLKGNTISIRLAGVDAPEGPHFGRPGQPYAAEALTFLSDYIRHRSVRARIYKRDQYNRIVATVHVRRFLFQKDVGLELLKLGLATTYEAKSGIEWGGKKEIYEAAQAKAKAKKLGMWSAKSSDFESPRAYKAKLHEAEKEADAKIVQEKKSWWRRWLS